MKNKVDGITLLQMIKDEKIKDGTKFRMFGLALTRDNPPHELVKFNGRTILHRFGELSLSQLLNFDLQFEIIEEVEKPKYIVEWGETVLDELKERNLNLSDVNIYLDLLVQTQQETIKSLNYLLKKEEDK